MPAAPSPIHGRRLEALLACAANPLGLRSGTYSSVMPVLEAMGLVARKTKAARGRSSNTWFLTAAGRRAVEELGTGETGAPAV